MADLVRYNAEFEGDASNWLEVLLRSWQITALTPFDKKEPLAAIIRREKWSSEESFFYVGVLGTESFESISTVTYKNPLSLDIILYSGNSVVRFL